MIEFIVTDDTEDIVRQLLKAHRRGNISDGQLLDSLTIVTRGGEPPSSTRSLCYRVIYYYPIYGGWFKLVRVFCLN